jgi:hypothetical protein
MTDPRTGSRWILGEKFDQVYPHLESIDALWYKKWKFPCERSLYPCKRAISHARNYHTAKM